MTMIWSEIAKASWSRAEQRDDNKMYNAYETAKLGVDIRMVGFMNQSELGEAYAIADCLTLRLSRLEGDVLTVRFTPIRPAKRGCPQPPAGGSHPDRRGGPRQIAQG